MKTLYNHLILFDAECPLCRAYTRAFVSSGLLEDTGRSAYQDLPEQACPMLDRQRAVNEIALVNQQTGEVLYGISSLFKVFAAALPALRPLFACPPFIWLAGKLYAFISYNRRVIIPAPASTNSYQLQPSFRLNYRLAYLIVTWLLTAWILSAYASLLHGLLPEGPAWREYVICGGQVFFQGIIISVLDQQKRWDYLGNMMTISFAGALLLLPALLTAPWLPPAPALYATWFMAVAGLMLLEHLRRTRLLALGWILTISWVLYRLLVFIFIFLFR
jgi:predicted DCC family thiol-disulfide oxidoreductase YuxK